MNHYLAFLRAINVGGHVVKMEALRQSFTELGFAQVETFIASGNVSFEAPSTEPTSLEKQIEEALQAGLGYPVATFVRSAAELAEIAAYPPFAGLEIGGASIYVGFLKQALEPQAEQAVLAFRSAVDEFAVHGREIYWLCRIRSSDSAFSLARLEKALKIQATFRNSTTLKKMAALYAGRI